MLCPQGHLGGDVALHTWERGPQSGETGGGGTWGVSQGGGSEVVRPACACPQPRCTVDPGCGSSAAWGLRSLGKLEGASKRSGWEGLLFSTTSTHWPGVAGTGTGEGAASVQRAVLPGGTQLRGSGDGAKQPQWGLPGGHGVRRGGRVVCGQAGPGMGQGGAASAANPGCWPCPECGRHFQGLLGGLREAQNLFICPCWVSAQGPRAGSFPEL